VVQAQKMSLVSYIQEKNVALELIKPISKLFVSFLILCHLGSVKSRALELEYIVGELG